GWIEFDEFSQVTRERSSSMIEEKDGVALKEVARVAEVQEPVDDEKQRKKTDDCIATPAKAHGSTGLARATIDTPNGRFTRRKTLLSSASNPTSESLISFGST